MFVMASVGSVFGQAGVVGPCVTHFGQRDWALLLETVPFGSKAKFLENAEVRKQQADNLRDLFAHACDAVKRGIAGEKANAVELRNIRSETMAVTYDREISNQKTGVPFSTITDAQVEKFYTVAGNVAQFGEFLETKIALLRSSNPGLSDRVPTEDEKKRARELFAKIKISESAFLKSPIVKPKLRSTAELQARLQQAQFLASVSVKGGSRDVLVSNADVDRYIALHPEFDESKKRDVAAKLLARAIAGEDFAALANQYSEDPGNNGSDGTKQGGLYTGIKKGVFVPTFEKAALSVEPGRLYPSLVKSDFGFHIIRLEKVIGDGTELQYDARHILISTGFKDPENPGGREMPVRAYVKAKLEGEKEAAVMSKVLAANPVVVEEYIPVAKPAASVKPAAIRRPVRRKRS